MTEPGDVVFAIVAALTLVGYGSLIVQGEAPELAAGIAVGSAVLIGLLLRAALSILTAEDEIVGPLAEAAAARPPASASGPMKEPA